jgi:hypothetical protein
MAITILIYTVSAQAAEPNWSIVKLETLDNKVFAYFAANGDFSPLSGEQQGNFRIGCSHGARHVFLTTGKMEKGVDKISVNGFADIELYNGKREIVIEGRCALLKDENTVNFIADGVDKNMFNLIAKTLMSATDKLSFRIREASRDKPGFTFAAVIEVGKRAPATVAQVLRNCRYR